MSPLFCPSSANAYMLMYRQVDKTANQCKLSSLYWLIPCDLYHVNMHGHAAFPKNEELPAHILQQIKEEKEQEQRERERQEWEKHLCKVCNFVI